MVGKVTSPLHCFVRAQSSPFGNNPFEGRAEGEDEEEDLMICKVCVCVCVGVCDLLGVPKGNRVLQQNKKKGVHMNDYVHRCCVYMGWDTCRSFQSIWF